MTFVSEGDEGGISLRAERLTIAVFVLTIAAFMLFDIVDDLLEGISPYHVVPEALIATLGMGTAAFLFLRFAQKRHFTLSRVRDELESVKRDASEWRSQAGSLRVGLSAAINSQLLRWGLTKAEQDIVYMLLKGLSFQEISALRETSERTVRQQASQIYKKCGLSGRSQLTAFFLEDLLGPQQG